MFVKNFSIHIKQFIFLSCSFFPFFEGVKLRLIKSNSCASRLELTGTQPDDHRMGSRNNSISNFDHEESVRTMIRRIESNSFNAKKVPRIIESKCIEKTNEAKAKQYQFGKNGDMTAVVAATAAAVASAMADRQNSPQATPPTAPATTAATATTKAPPQTSAPIVVKTEPRLGPVEILSQVSVNNHINGLNAMAANDKPANKANVIPRNKNVDLALELSKNQSKSVVTKTVKDQTNGLKKLSGSTVDGATNGEKTATTNTNVPKSKIIDNERLQNMMEDLSAAIAKQADQINNNQQPNMQNTKLSKWDSATVYADKNYITNDISLKQKPKYDDIDFEEYEVIEPST